KPVDYSRVQPGIALPPPRPRPAEDFSIDGVEVHVAHSGAPEDLAAKVTPLLPSGLALTEILTARGDRVWPEKTKFFRTDVMALRLMFSDAAARTEGDKRAAVAGTLSAFAKAG